MVLAPLSVQRVGYGLINACLAPVLNHVVDQKRLPLHGAINGMYTATTNLGIVLGKL